MRMTGKEVLEESTKHSKKLGETYGRLQQALFAPLIKRTYELLKTPPKIKDK